MPSPPAPSRTPAIAIDALREFFAGQIDPVASALLDELRAHDELRARATEAMSRIDSTPPSLDPVDWFDTELSRLS